MRLCSWIADGELPAQCAAQLATESAANDFEASPRGNTGQSPNTKLSLKV
jgi:hypothetical protein